MKIVEVYVRGKTQHGIRECSWFKFLWLDGESVSLVGGQILNLDRSGRLIQDLVDLGLDWSGFVKRPASLMTCLTWKVNP